MPQQSANTTITFIDTTISQSMEFLSTLMHQVLQLIFCLLALIAVGRYVSSHTARRHSVAQSDESVGTVPEDVKVDEEVPSSGWESEPMETERPQLEVPPKVIKQKLNIPRRKCISVGPVMLTPNSQIIRKVNVEEREERYRYDILPLNTDHVCVPEIYFYYFFIII
jgi:hypothetical protein